MESASEAAAPDLDVGQPARRFSFMPADKRQALRVRRFLMAAATSLLVVVTFFLSALFGIVPLDAAIRGACGIGAFIVIFYGLLRSGLNLRFGDPSLTTEQVGSAILLLAYVMYNAPESRGVLIILYLVAMMFGVLRLGTLRLLALAALALAAHSLVVWLSIRGDPAFDQRSGCGNSFLSSSETMTKMAVLRVSLSSAAAGDMASACARSAHTVSRARDLLTNRF